MCSTALALLVIGGLAAVASSLSAYRARTLHAPTRSVWDVYLEGPAGYSPRGIQLRKLALICGAIGLASFLAFVGLVVAGATC